MNFDLFINTLPNILPLALPSSSSHLKMAPLERAKLLKENNYNINLVKKAAVMMLCYPKNNITHLLLIVRNSYTGIHSSQIAFPGGKAETSDLNLKHTALRETEEEIGIPIDTIDVIKNFSTIYIPPSNFLVYPFLGISKSELTFKLQEKEVAEIIEFPISLLLDDAIISIKNIKTSYSNFIDVPVFQIQNHIVWGATAMMLSELKDVLKMVF